ncbi:lipase [Streptomyces sp. MB22_4]|uniref:lipase n=1 Tax=Streptomyces sp. MB22_4 TaxID=3383120 RepID=UPI00399F7690
MAGTRGPGRRRPRDARVIPVVRVVAAALVGPSAVAAMPYLVLGAGHGAGTVANGWESVERHLDTTSGSRAEGCPVDGRGDQDGTRVAYSGGVFLPSSGRFPLHSAPGWNTGGHPARVLLVLGANGTTADRAWADPGGAGGCGCGALSCPSTGLLHHLSERDHRVFAVGRAHERGGNLTQARIGGDAIAVSRTALCTAHREPSMPPDGGQDSHPGKRRMPGRRDGVNRPDGAARDRYTTHDCGVGFCTAGSGTQAAVDAGALISPPRRARVRATVTTHVLAVGSADVLGSSDGDRGPGDGFVALSGALAGTGVPTVGGKAAIATAHHLEPGGHRLAAAQAATRLSRSSRGRRTRRT